VQWWGLGDGESPRLVSGFYGPVSGYERRVKTESVARNTLRRLDEQPEAGRGFMRLMVISAFVQRWLSYHPWMVSELTMVALRSRVMRGCGAVPDRAVSDVLGACFISGMHMTGCRTASARKHRGIEERSLFQWPFKARLARNKTWMSPSRITSRIAITRTGWGQPDSELWLGKDSLDDWM
jgi:hypothetical protein